MPAPDLSGIDARIRSARAAAGLSTRELAELAGVSQYTIVNLEQEPRENTAISTLFRIADALKVPREWLILGKVAVPSPGNDPPPKN